MPEYRVETVWYTAQQQKYVAHEKDPIQKVLDQWAAADWELVAATVLREGDGWKHYLYFKHG